MIIAPLPGEIRGEHMETAWIYLCVVIFSIIALSGTIVCIRGLKKWTLSFHLCSSS